MSNPIVLVVIGLLRLMLLSSGDLVVVLVGCKTECMRMVSMVLVVLM